MDRLDWRGGLFLDWASAAFGDGERHGSGELSEESSDSCNARVIGINKICILSSSYCRSQATAV